MLKVDPYEKLDENQTSDNQTRSEDENTKTIRKDAILSVIIDAFSSLMRAKPTQAASSISYYSLFSIFPLILFIVVVLSFFLEYTVIQKEIILLFSTIIPGSETFIIENLQNILSNRTTTSITATITLLWSGSGAFNGIISNIHLAWPESKGRGYFVNRFFAIIGIILIILSLVSLTVVALSLNFSEIFSLFDIHVSNFLRILLDIVLKYILPVLLLYAAFYLLYHKVPTVEVDQQAAKIGAWVTSLTWRIFTTLFGIFILSPLNKYDLVYGSVTTIILLLLYIFICALIILFSAHLVAAITHYKIKKGIPFSQHTVKVQAAPKPKKARRSIRELSDQAGEKFANWTQKKIMHAATKQPKLNEQLEKMEAEGKLNQIKQKLKDFFGVLFRW